MNTKIVYDGVMVNCDGRGLRIRTTVLRYDGRMQWLEMINCNSRDMASNTMAVGLRLVLPEYARHVQWLQTGQYHGRPVFSIL